MMTIYKIIEDNIKIIDRALDKYVNLESKYERVIYESMRYSLFSGGKRLRPIIAIKTFDMFDDRKEKVLPYAASIEMIHTYSLIHDDLPAMDEDSMLKCVMFKYSAKSLSMDLADGQKIIAKGYVSIYEQTGAYQLYVKEISSKGLGDLYLAYEKLKQELEKEGLFKKEFKKDLPTMPRKVGIVTSSTGAAIRDIVSVIKRRFPPCEILIYPSLSQGPIQLSIPNINCVYLRGLLL
jgi:hypothetical protein